MDSSSFHAMRTVTEMTAQVLVSPDHLGLPDNPLVRTISSAKEEVLVEAMELEPDFLLPGMSSDRTLSEPSPWCFPGVYHPPQM